MKPLSILPVVAAVSVLALTPSTAAAQGCSGSAQQRECQKPSILETATAAGDFNTLAAALKAADLIAPLQGKGPFTVFAPTDEAFAKLPKGTVENLLKKENRGTLSTILTYHVVAGAVPAEKVVKLKNASALNGQRLPIQVGDEGVRVAGVKVVTTDIECSNGIIHVVDAVMIPSTEDVIGTAVAAGKFTTLGAAIEAAGLIEALRGDGPFTVFAPTDDAFAALPEGTVASLLQPENREKLQAVLKYHVVSGRVYSDQLKSSRVPTLQGSDLTVRVERDRVSVNEATVVMADIDTTNGVVHVVDKVLLPR